MAAAALAFVLLAAPAFAGDVISAAPQHLAVTVYRDDAIADPASPNWNGYGLGMITETRQVTLPAGLSRVVFEGVADGIIPETVALSGFPGSIAEQNFDADLLSPATLIQRSVGETVQVSRINPKTGKRTQERAILRSGPNGEVLDFGGRVEALGCSGNAEGVTLAKIPTGLSGKPKLSINVRAARAGTYRVKLAYLTTGLAWKAAYVAQLEPGDAGSGKLALTGWITLANHGEVGYADADTSVVAGRLARNALRIAARYLPPLSHACWPTGNSHHPHGIDPYLAQEEDEDERPTGSFMAAPKVMAPRAASMSMMMMAPPPPPPPPRAQQSDLGDYKLYTLDEPATVAAKQTKQVAFLGQPSVAYEVVQVYRASPRAGYGVAAWPTTTTFRFQNTTAKGLGHALPAGKVAFQTAVGENDLYLGGQALKDTPTGEPFELDVGRSRDVTVQDTTTGITRGQGKEVVFSRQMVAANAGSKAATVEIRQPQAGRGFAIVTESQAHGLKSGDPIWTLTLPPGQALTLTYAFRVSR